MRKKIRTENFYNYVKYLENYENSIKFKDIYFFKSVSLTSIQDPVDRSMILISPELSTVQGMPSSVNPTQDNRELK